ncbi:MAG: hypothetical protein PVH87_14060 [Desulfobacteraceae bacterium]|jgi:hypothetical protein
MRLKTTMFLMIISIALSLFISGCAVSPDRYHPDYAAHRAVMRRILILPPEIDLFENIPGGHFVRQEAQSRDAGLEAQKALVRALSAHAFDVRIAGRHLLRSDDVIELRALFRNVNRAIQLHAYGPQLYPGRSRQIDYGVGSVSDLLESGNADALLLITGRQTASGHSPGTWISAAVVEPTGKIIWYGVQGTKGPDAVNDRQTVIDLTRMVIQPFLKGMS